MPNGTEASNSTIGNATISGATPSAGLPTDLSSLIAFLYSFSGLRDYFKLIILGGALETLRRLYSTSYGSLVDRFFITASFESDDDAFQWMMFWLSSIPQWRQFRDFTVSTSTLGLGTGAIELDGDESDPTHGKTRPVRYLPAYAASYKMWYKRRWMKISRIKEESRWYSDKSTLMITILSRDRSVLDALILEARQTWLSARSDKIDIYAMESYGSDWRHVTSRPKRSINSIILDVGVKELILDDARDFLKSKKWYAERGIPFRRGYLLYGAPGSGKTSIIHSLAGELGLDIYIISLSKYNLDDATLSGLISSLPPECVAIMEDIDAAFTHGITRDTVGTELEDPRQRDPSRSQDPNEPNNNNDDPRERGNAAGPGGGSKDTRITLSGLLNALDGVSAQEGRLLFATTNRYSVLDPALTRPGRMDLHVEFRLASRYQACEMFKRFYVPDAPAGSSQQADAEKEDEEKAEEESVDSGYGTPIKDKSTSKDLIDLSADSTTPPSPAHSAASLAPDAAPNYNGITHSSRSPALSKKRIEALAARFADSIPEREFSMASLQGYLMAYKVRPVQAVEDIVQWVNTKQEERDRKSKGGARADQGARIVEVKPSVQDEAKVAEGVISLRS